MKKCLYCIMVAVTAVVFSYGCSGGGKAPVDDFKPSLVCPEGGLPPKLSASLRYDESGAISDRPLNDGTLLPLKDGYQYKIVISTASSGDVSENLKKEISDASALFPTGGGTATREDLQTGETLVTIKVDSDPQWEGLGKIFTAKASDNCGSSEFKINFEYYPADGYLIVRPDDGSGDDTAMRRLPIRPTTTDDPATPEIPVMPGRPLAPSFYLITTVTTVTTDDGDNERRAIVVTKPVDLRASTLLISAEIKVVSNTPLIGFQETVGSTTVPLLPPDSSNLLEFTTTIKLTVIEDTAYTFTAENDVETSTVTINVLPLLPPRSLRPGRDGAGDPARLGLPVRIDSVTDGISVLLTLLTLPEITNTDDGQSPQIYVVGKYRKSMDLFEPHSAEQLTATYTPTFDSNRYKKLLIYVVDPDGDPIADPQYYSDAYHSIDIATESVSVEGGGILFQVPLNVPPGVTVPYDLSIVVNSSSSDVDLKSTEFLRVQ